MGLAFHLVHFTATLEPYQPRNALKSSQPRLPSGYGPQDEDPEVVENLAATDLGTPCHPDYLMIDCCALHLKDHSESCRKHRQSHSRLIYMAGPRCCTCLDVITDPKLEEMRTRFLYKMRCRGLSADSRM